MKCNNYFVVKFFHYSMRLFFRIYEKSAAEYKKSLCSAHSTVQFYSSSKVDNLRGDKSAIQIGANTVVLGQLLVFKHDGQIKVGKDCYIGEYSRIWSASSIDIGDRVLISHGVNVHDTNAHSLSAQKRHQHFVDIFSTGHPEILDDVIATPVVIEDDAWIGFNATILKGVTVGKGAIVGACSVVTHDVSPYSSVAGNPAKVIGQAVQ